MNIKGAALLTGFVALLGFGGAVYAGKVELTTYYPAPVGEYNTLKTKRLTTGDNLPDRDGDILLKPQTGVPETEWTATPANTGQFAYSASANALYHSDGSVWAPAGGATGPTVITVATWWTGWVSEGGFPLGSIQFYRSGTLPNCPVGWTSVATYDEPVSSAAGTFVSLSSPVVIGRSVRICTK